MAIPENKEEENLEEEEENEPNDIEEEMPYCHKCGVYRKACEDHRDNCTDCCTNHTMM